MFIIQGKNIILYNLRYLYFSDEETKEDLDKLRKNDKPIASLTFKINNVTLTQEKLENKEKLKKGFDIKKLILSKKKAYLEKLKKENKKNDNCRALIIYL